MHSILGLSVKEPPQHPNTLSSYTFVFSMKSELLRGDIRATGWRRLIGSPKLQIIFHKRATKYRALLPKTTYSDKGPYESSPPCILVKDSEVSFAKGCYQTRAHLQKRHLWHEPCPIYVTWQISRCAHLPRQSRSCKLLYKSCLMWMSPVPYARVSSHLNESQLAAYLPASFAVANWCMSHVSYERVMSHMNKSHHIWMSHSWMLMSVPPIPHLQIGA